MVEMTVVVKDPSATVGMTDEAWTVGMIERIDRL